MSNNIKDMIRNHIKDDLDKFTFNDETFDRMKNALKHNRFVDTTICVKIFNGDVEIIYDTHKKEQNRKRDMMTLLKNAISYYKEKGINFPNVLFYLYVTDTYAYQFQDLPFFIMAKPSNKTGILFPDNTYVCHDVNKKCYSWPKTVNECNRVDYPKENVMFFAGANTDAGRQNIRSGLHHLEDKVDFPLKILLQQPRLNVCEFKQFKYLLNLPGNQPWSYRFKYLFLMKSLVVNVNVIQKYDEGTEWNEGWINFFDIIFEKDVDYINIDYYWKENNENGVNDKQFDLLVTKLSEIYKHYEEKSDEYDTMVNNGYNKVSAITEKLIYWSIHELFKQYSEKYDFSKLM